MAQLKLSVKVYQKPEESEYSNIEESTLLAQSVLFPLPEVPYPELKVLSDVEEFKAVFKAAFQLFKQAQEYFVLDGHVTEHTQLMQDTSFLYSLLSEAETDQLRIRAMQERRVQLLSPLVDQINPQAYVARWQELAWETTELCCELSDSAQKKATRRQWTERAVHYCSRYLDFLKQTHKKEEMNKEQLQAQVNGMFTLARLYSKHDWGAKEFQVEQQVKALQMYEAVRDVVRTHIGLLSQAQEQLSVCSEMCELLPHKIHNLHYRK